MLRAKLFPICKKKISRNLSDFISAVSDTHISKSPIPSKYEYLPLPLYGGNYTVTAIPGIGIGIELMKYIKNVIEETSVPIFFEEIHIDPSIKQENPLSLIKTAIKRNRVALKGCIESEYQGYETTQHNIELKSELDLYISILHCKPYPHVKCLNPEIDIIVARQNSEGEYLMLEHEIVKGTVEALKLVTRDKTEQYARWALNYARAHGRKHVTVIHRRDTYPLTDGLFVTTVLGLAKDFRDLKFNTMRLTTFLEKLIKKPTSLDFIMVPNLYGCIIMNLACGLLGGPGLLSKKSYSSFYAVFEPAIGSLAKGLLGKDIVNPVAMLNATRDMLAYLKMDRDARAIDCAVKRTLCRDRIQTPDLGGSGTTSEFIDRVKYYIRNYTD